MPSILTAPPVPYNHGGKLRNDAILVRRATRPHPRPPPDLGPGLGRFRTHTGSDRGLPHRERLLEPGHGALPRQLRVLRAARMPCRCGLPRRAPLPRRGPPDRAPLLLEGRWARRDPRTSPPRVAGGGAMRHTRGRGHRDLLGPHRSRRWPRRGAGLPPDPRLRAGKRRRSPRDRDRRARSRRATADRTCRPGTCRDGDRDRTGRASRRGTRRRPARAAKLRLCLPERRRRRTRPRHPRVPAPRRPPSEDPGRSAPTPVDARKLSPGQAGAIATWVPEVLEGGPPLRRGWAFRGRNRGGGPGVRTPWPSRRERGGCSSP